MKDPAFVFYTADFMIGTSEMTNEEVGQYIRLMCYQHQKGHLSRELIDRLVPNISSYVLSKFKQDKDENYYNERLEKETVKRALHREKQSENGKKGGRGKKPNESQTKPNTNPNQSQTKPKSKPLEIENEIVIEIDNELEDRDKESVREKEKETKAMTELFHIFWKFYPKKVAKKDALKAFLKLSPSQDLMESILKHIEIAKQSKEWQKDKGQFVPNAATYLNGERWEDEEKTIVENEPEWLKGAIDNLGDGGW